VHIGAQIMEELHHRCVAAIGCHGSWSSSINRGWLVKVCPQLMQQPNYLKLILLRRTKGCCAVVPRVDEIDKCPHRSVGRLRKLRPSNRHRELNL